MYKTEKYHLMHRVAVICGKERELYVRNQRLQGEAKSSSKSGSPSYNGGRIYEIPEQPSTDGSTKSKTGFENVNDPDVIRDMFAKYTSVELEDNQLEKSGYIMEMECR